MLRNGSLLLSDLNNSDNAKSMAFNRFFCQGDKNSNKYQTSQNHFPNQNKDRTKIKQLNKIGFSQINKPASSSLNSLLSSSQI